MFTEGSQHAQVPGETRADQAEGHCLLGRSIDAIFYKLIILYELLDQCPAYPIKPLTKK